MFGNRIKELRLQKGLSKVEFAKRIGVSEGTVRAWERGTNEPRWGVLRKISAIYKVSENWLIGMEDDEDEVELNYYGAVSAGHFESVSVENENIKIPRSILRGLDESECFILKVNGDSMNKVIANGSNVVIHDYREADSPQYRTSDILLIRNGGSHTLKRVRLTDTKIHLEPDSYIDEFKTDTYDIELSDDIEIIGKVIYNYRLF